METGRGLPALDLHGHFVVAVYRMKVRHSMLAIEHAGDYFKMLQAPAMFASVLDLSELSGHRNFILWARQGPTQSRPALLADVSLLSAGEFATRN